MNEHTVQRDPADSTTPPLRIGLVIGADAEAAYYRLVPVNDFTSVLQPPVPNVISVYLPTDAYDALFETEPTHEQKLQILAIAGDVTYDTLTGVYQALADQHYDDAADAYIAFVARILRRIAREAVTAAASRWLNIAEMASLHDCVVAVAVADDLAYRNGSNDPLVQILANAFPKATLSVYNFTDTGATLRVLKLEDPLEQ